MPMEPLDMMWMSKAPTVSDVVQTSNVVFKPAVSQPNSPSDEGIRPDFDTDCLWKPMPRRKPQDRTASIDSTDSEVGRKMSFNETGVSSSPVEIRPRRLSISEMIFGSPSGGFSWGQSSAQSTAQSNNVTENDRKGSVTEDLRFKELMKHQSKILGNEGN